MITTEKRKEKMFSFPPTVTHDEKNRMRKKKRDTEQILTFSNEINQKLSPSNYHHN